MLFSWEPALWLVLWQERVWTSKKIIDIFTHKQQHLSIDMKTKIVQHVPRINISIWHKTCDMRHVTCHMWHNYKYSLLSLHMKTRVVQHVPRINISIWHLTFDMRNVTCDIWHAKCDMLHVTLLQILTSEQRHENKSCSECPKDQHELLTYDMRNVTCDIWHVKCDIITNTHFWA